MNSLLVGVGISDRAAPGDDPVADAVTAEAAGYDFVSAFDHPVADAATAQAIGYDRLSAVGRPGSAADIIEQLHGLTELGFTGFDLMPSRDQIRAVAQDVLPALRALPIPADRPPPRRSPDAEPGILRPGLRPRPATAISPVGPAPEVARAAS